MSEDETISDAQREQIRKDKEALARGESLSSRDVTVKVEVEQPTEVSDLERSKLWNSALTGLVSEYEKLGRTFDASMVKSEAQLQHEFDNLRELKEKQSQIESLSKNQGISVSGNYQTDEKLDAEKKGKTISSSGDRDIEKLKQSTKDIPLELVQYNSVKEMKDLLLNISMDTNDPRQKEALGLYQKALSSQVGKSQTLEFEGTGKELIHGKGSWKKKRPVED
jgi:predicted RNase H-like nuclease (RuvC/YqgF family)